MKHATYLAPLGLASSALAQILDCRSSDFTPGHWASNGVEGFWAQNLFSSDTPAQFPNSFFLDFDRSDFSAFDCTKFQIGGNCRVPVGPDGTVCSNFLDPKAAFVVQSYVNLHDYLINLHNGVRVVAVMLQNGGFLDTMATSLSRAASHIPAEVSSKLRDLSFFFIPVSGAGPSTGKKAGEELAKFTNFVTDIGQKAINDGHSTIEGITDVLNNFVSGFQLVVEEQFKEIFIDDAPDTLDGTPLTDNLHFNILSEGRQLGLPQGRQEMVDILEKNMMAFLVAAFTTKSGWTLVIDNQPTCDGGDIAASDGCRRIRVSQGPGAPITSASERPQNIDVLTAFGLDLTKIMDNAVDCARTGGSADHADLNGFLTSADANFPRCMFGYQVLHQ